MATTAPSGHRSRFMPRNSSGSAATTAQVWNEATNLLTIRAREPRWWRILHAALQAAQVEPPYLLVGQSHGALFSRLFAATYPDEVAGLLLLDPWPEDFDRSIASAWSRTSNGLPTRACWQTSRTMKSIDFHATYDELRSAGALPDVPLLILSHGQPPSRRAARQDGRSRSRSSSGSSFNKNWPS